jgi:hypothetical protein
MPASFKIHGPVSEHDPRVDFGQLRSPERDKVTLVTELAHPDFCIAIGRRTLASFKRLPGFAVGDSGQDTRAAARFALLAMAGELATEHGVTRWAAGQATEAAQTMFRLWQSQRRGQNEPRQVLEQLVDFIDRLGDPDSHRPAATMTATVTLRRHPLF